jgi:hypothetical protein
MQAAVAPEVQNSIGQKRSDDLCALIRCPEPTEASWKFGVLVKVREVKNSVRDKAWKNISRSSLAPHMCYDMLENIS